MALFPSSPATSIHSIDLLDALQAKAAEGGLNSSPIRRFLEITSAEPPNDVRATPSEIQMAQNFFAANAVPITLSLLYFSLGGGFAS